VAALALRPGEAAWLYSLAWLQIKAGNPQASLSTLARLFETDPGFRPNVAADPDFAFLHADRTFRALVDPVRVETEHR
jgi:hypothetical protein